MTRDQFEAARATFPWKHVLGANGVITIVDAGNTPVPLLQVIAVMQFLTAAHSTPRDKK